MFCILIIFFNTFIIPYFIRSICHILFRLICNNLPVEEFRVCSDDYCSTLKYYPGHSSIGYYQEHHYLAEEDYNVIM